MPHAPDHSLPSSTCGSGQPHPPVSSSVAPSSPPHSLAAVEALALHAEAQLNRWFDATPDPTLEQLDIASQAIWRIAAVHKTVLFANNPPAHPSGSGPGSGPRRKGKDPDAEFFRAMNARMSEVDQFIAQLLPPPAPKRLAVPTPAQAPAPAPECSSAAAPAPSQPAGTPADLAPAAADAAALSEPAAEAIAILKSMGIHVPDYEDIPVIPDLPACAELPGCAELGAIPQIRAIRVIPRLRYRTPKPAPPSTPPFSESTTGATLSTASPAQSKLQAPQGNPPVCPTLRNPIQSARAALRQANQLCKQAGLPAESLSVPSTEAGPSTSSPESTSSIPSISPEPHASTPAVPAPSEPIRVGPSSSADSLLNPSNHPPP